MVLANFGVWLGICVGLGVKRIFFGTLRGIEYEVSCLFYSVARAGLAGLVWVEMWTFWPMT